MRDGAWRADGRFIPEHATTPSGLWPRFPLGTPGISLVSGETLFQENLFFPINPGLVAVNRPSDPDYGSRVYDMRGDTLDKDAWARLQTKVWVIKKPTG